MEKEKKVNSDSEKEPFLKVLFLDWLPMFLITLGLVLGILDRLHVIDLIKE
ncbi:MAG: hypothetical protein NTZ83_00320 [Candidatus Pacearchaeota archaeon]|nr:hypothetical protein [Candidatus Pacearchaeota archaeon]